jgi:hypothetical protein
MTVTTASFRWRSKINMIEQFTFILRNMDIFSLIYIHNVGETLLRHRILSLMFLQIIVRILNTGRKVNPRVKSMSVLN